MYFWSRAGRPRSLAALGLLLLCCSDARSGDTPWKDKPYRKWDEKDVARVFTDSPWQRSATITRSWTPSRRDLPQKPIEGSVQSLPQDVQHTSDSSSGEQLTFRFYWISSRVMRAASARKAALQGGSIAPDTDKYVNMPQDEYQILVQSSDMTPFLRHDEEFFQQNAWLQIKKSKLKLVPTRVLYQRAGTGVDAAVFFFARKSPSGAPAISPDEKSVEFSLKLEGSTLRVTFDPQKMVDQSGPDF